MVDFKQIVDDEKFFNLLKNAENPSAEIVMGVLDNASLKKGLSLEEAAVLLNVEDENLLQKMFEVAGRIKQEIYGNRLVLFAPLYVSSFCVNNCRYCGFHSENKSERKKLSLDEVEKEVLALERMGHKRLLLEFGEHPLNTIDYVVEVIKKIYETKAGNGEIRRVNVNIAATTNEDYAKLKSAGIGTYQLFQETYHKKTFEELHAGPKADFTRQLFAHDRAFAAGIDDLGIGVLFGLYDYKFEVLGLLSHAEYMQKTFGVGPHTISVPRFQPAESVSFKSNFPVSETDLLKIIAILRMAVPYTGMIISTRERPEIRKKAFDLGISQASAASRTSPGEYSNKAGGNSKRLQQFLLADERNIGEVIEGVLKQGYIPSFCTACYRKGRTGDEFMPLAIGGSIHNFCLPNALLTLKEYLEDFATPDLLQLGNEAISSNLANIEKEQMRLETESRLLRIEAGERDLLF